MTIILAVGKDIEGDLINLYTGPSYAHGEAALIAAGREGLISEGWVFNNPEPTMHQWYQLKAQHEEEDVFKRRGPGRPPKITV